ncbi:hypothetical protein AAE478_009285 [Parahypoxylon ruwenzoriense]
MPLRTRENLIQYSRYIYDNSDNGEEADDRQIFLHPLARQTVRATQWAEARGSKVLGIELPSLVGRYFSLPSVMSNYVEGLNYPCVTYFGGDRSYLDDPEPNALRKMTSLLCSMIAQLINFLPAEIDDVEGALSRRRFDRLWLPDADGGGPVIYVPAAIRMIQTLTFVGPRELFFIFEGCDDLTESNGLLSEHFSELLCYLARPPAGRVWKILWTGPIESMPFRRMRRVAASQRRFDLLTWSDGDWLA